MGSIAISIYYFEHGVNFWIFKLQSHQKSKRDYQYSNKWSEKANRGYTQRSETDTELIVLLMKYFYDKHQTVTII
ncbi:hypothetical protein HZS_1236 [Henneguya salminicola]|nr:hypothetical protein HZS_1236 [Henneguya salminicola]